MRDSFFVNHPRVRARTHGRVRTCFHANKEKCTLCEQADAMMVNTYAETYKETYKETHKETYKETWISKWSCVNRQTHIVQAGAQTYNGEQDYFFN